MEKSNIILGPGRLKYAEHENNHWVANVPEGTSVQDLERLDFWSTFSGKLQPYDRIEVRIDTMDWIAEALVIASDKTWAKVVVLQHFKLSKDTPTVTMGHRVEYKGPQYKHCIIRESDGAIIKQGISKKDDAYLQLLAYEKAIK